MQATHLGEQTTLNPVVSWPMTQPSTQSHTAHAPAIARRDLTIPPDRTQRRKSQPDQPSCPTTTKFDWTVSIVSPWMENGNAHDYVQDEAIDPCPLVSVHHRGGIYLNTTQIVGIAKGLHYLHNHKPNPIFHGDMKGVGQVTFQT